MPFKKGCSEQIKRFWDGRRTRITKTCEICGIKFITHLCVIKLGKGKYCSGECGRKLAAKTRKKNGQGFQSGKDHPFWKGGTSTYRENALEEYGEVCSICGYNNEPSLLWVHHKDFKGRTGNNDLNNLEVLCIRCHLKKHLEYDRAICQ